MPLCTSCLCGREKGPQISGPIHLMVKPHDLGVQNHAFRTKVFRNPETCHICHHPIYHQGSFCQACKYSCHSSCQLRVITACNSTSNKTKNCNGVKHRNSIPKSQSTPANWLPDNLSSSSSSSYHHSRQLNHRYYSNNIEMDLTYITERVIAMTFPFIGMEKVYRNNLKEVTQMLKTKHADKYMIFNLSERRYDIVRLNRQVLDFGWPDRLAPPLERLCSICKAMDSWLNSGDHHVVVLHCKGGKERTGVVIEAYRHYSNICASADQALDRFAMKRFYDDKVGSLTQPSQKRYVQYFSGLLSGHIKINNSPLYLHHVIINGIPNFDGKGGCKAFLKIYQGMHPIYASGIYNFANNMRRVVIPLDLPLQLRGDILIKCYHKARPSAREVIFRCQFHTCAISEYTLILTKDELDDGCQDKRFPDDSRVELKFSSTSNLLAGHSINEMPTPNEPATDPIVRWDSYENFDIVPEDSGDHSDEIDRYSPTGPMDGSLYATVGKKKIMMMPSSAIMPVNGTIDDFTNGFHTTSMDSGISSASGHPGHMTSISTTPSQSGTAASPAIVNGTTTSASSSPTIRAEVHNAPLSEEESKLDEALSGMLETAQTMPDIKPGNRSQYARTVTTTYTVHQNGKSHHLPEETEDDLDGPYHARKDCQPFTYLVPTSPSLQRKHLGAPSIPSAPRTPSPIRSAALVLESTRHSPSLPTTPEPRFEEEFLDNPKGWLYKQQLKLRERQEARVHADRHFRERKLISELRNAQSKFVPPQSDSSFDEDAYLSDTIASLEAFSSRETSPMKGPSRGYSTPLHINTYNGYSSQPPSQHSGSYPTSKPPIYQSTPIGRGSSAPSSPLIPSRSSSRDIRNRYPWPATQPKPVQRQRSDTSHDRERPFVAVKRAHEQARKQPDTTNYPFHQSYAYSYQSTPQPGYSPMATSSPITKPGSPTGLLATVTPTSRALSSSPATRPTNEPYDRDGATSPSLKFLDRPITPGFPVLPRTPYANRESPLPIQTTGLPPKSPTSIRRANALSATGGGGGRNQLRRWPSNPTLSATNGWSKERSPSPSMIQQLQSELLSKTPQSDHPLSPTGQSSPSVYFGQSCRSSLTSLVEPSEIISHTPLFVKDTSKYWYKPNISREGAINALKDKPPGTFIVRDSNSFPGAYGLALKVATPPPNVQNKSGDISNELVRHFLIEPTSQGVRLKGCANEPVFGSLSALVYQHSITPMALPCKLILPDADTVDGVVDSASPNAAAQLLAQGAACGVFYLYSIDMELLTGPEAIRKASKTLLALKPLPESTAVHFKVSSQGITITDNNRKLFFRRHYPVNTISHCGLDPGERRWTEYNEETGQEKNNHRIFGFVAAKATNPNENQCHLFAELEPEQPAFAIVNFVTKVMMGPTGVKTLVNSP